MTRLTRVANFLKDLDATAITPEQFAVIDAAIAIAEHAPCVTSDYESNYAFNKMTGLEKRLTASIKRLVDHVRAEHDCDENDGETIG